MSRLKPDYTEGLHQISDNCYAWLQPGGGFCLSNAALLVDGDQSMLVDTLIDVPRTGTMLEAMKRVTPAARSIDTLVNTHAHPDHTAGNALLAGSRIVMSRTCAKEYQHIEAMIKGIDKMEGDALALMKELGVENFSTEGVSYVPPTETFEGALKLAVGGKNVELLEIGPSHAASDTMVYVPGEGVAFTGDMMFCDCHLVLNFASSKNWVRACEAILSWDVDTIVPGHGRVCDKQEVHRHLEYLHFLRGEARRRYDQGLPAEVAAYDIFENLGKFSYLKRTDLLLKNISALYAEFAGGQLSGSFAEHMADRWKFRNRVRGKAPGIHVNHIPDGN